MEIIKIGKETFKIFLTAKEAEEYELTNDDAQINASIKRLVEKIKEKEGIDFGKERISAELYISKDGGCEVFLSKAPSVKQALKSNSKPLSMVIYRFDKLKHLLFICNQLNTAENKMSSSIYHNKKAKTYYLTIYGIYPKDLKYAFICEYASRLKASIYPYIAEHCDLICENNAIEIFSKLL